MLEIDFESSTSDLNKSLDRVDAEYLDTIQTALDEFVSGRDTESISLAQIQRLTGIPATTLAPIIYLETQVEDPYLEFVSSLENYLYLDLQGKIDNFPNCHRILQAQSLQNAFRARSGHEETILATPRVARGKTKYED